MGMESKKFEVFKPLELTIKEPRNDKNFMIFFESKTERESFIYNMAMATVLQNHELNPFHQVGRDNEPGFHAWEIWQKSTKSDMESLLPEIQAEAEKNFKKW